MSDTSPIDRSSGGRVLGNTLWNLAGQVAPLLAAVIAIPLLIKGLGVERFGVLTLAWMVIGYFSLFDLGLGRALIKLVSEKLGADQAEEIPELVWTGLILMSLLGLLGCGLVLVLTNWLVLSALHITLALQRETAASFSLLAWSVPVVIITTGLRGVLESYQRFDLVNIVRVPMGVLTFASPVAVLPFSNQLDVIVLILLGFRVLACVVHAVLCARVVPGLFRVVSFSRRQVRPMLAFGGWMTVSNLVSPLMVYLDRFVIGSVLGLAAVAYYVTPYEVITKLWVFPGALVGVLFPLFSASMAGERSRAVNLFERGVRWTFIVLFPMTLVATVFASDGLRLWISEDFSRQSSTVLQCLATGVLINSLAHIPFAFIQGAGRPDFTAKLHLVELPFYLLALWQFMNWWGLVGAAAAWVLRAGVDATAMFCIAAWLERDLRPALKRQALEVFLGVTVLGLGALTASVVARIAFTAVILTCFAILVWRYLLPTEDRALLRRVLPRPTGTKIL